MEEREERAWIRGSLIGVLAGITIGWFMRQSLPNQHPALIRTEWKDPNPQLEERLIESVEENFRLQQKIDSLTNLKTNVY